MGLGPEEKGFYQVFHLLGYIPLGNSVLTASTGPHRWNAGNRYYRLRAAIDLSGVATLLHQPIAN